MYRSLAGRCLENGESQWTYVSRPIALCLVSLPLLHRIQQIRQEKKNPIDPGKALEEWKELLEKRSPQPNSGGKPFVLQIVDMVQKKKTHAGLDLTDKNAILEHLAEWCERICKEHGIDPGSEALQALRRQQQ